MTAVGSLPPLESKLPAVGTTIFTVMSQLAQAHGALNLSQGFPDFDGPPELLDRVTFYLRHGANQYAPMMGAPALRAALAEKVAQDYGATVDPDQEVTITSGATEALFCALQAVVRSGDEVVIFDPAYDSYDPAVVMAGGTPVHCPLQAPSFSLDFEALEARLSSRTRAVVINAPHNPTGTVLSEAELLRLGALAEHWGFWIISDEVYEHIIFDGVRHESVLRHPALAARSFMVSSLGKTYHTTGWKIGYCIAPAALTAEFRKIHQYVTFCTHHPTQLAHADFLRAHPEHHQGLPAFYQEKRDRMAALLAPSRFRFTPSAGTYFQLLEYDAISDEPDQALAERLTKEVGVATIPVSVFYAEPPAKQRLLRICFCKDDRTLEQAAERLCAI
ncbi:MAG: aminotransferase class I/II-fold pyridoxal phosphate-dependent enzyme [Pseudomonadales bacterium]|nr:aminotransferase class I/II-fold pyridoxal phosphate-dependent enzyme [Pseudomonadales bacterium]